MSAAKRHRHDWERVGGPPDEPWDGNVYLYCACGKTKPWPCVILWCRLPLGHEGRHKGLAQR